MGGQLDILQQKISTLSPEVQESVYSALRSGRYGSINIYAEERGGEWAQAKQYMDTFFNTPEGRRFETGMIEARTPYAQRFPHATRVEQPTPPTQPAEQPPSVFPPPAHPSIFGMPAPSPFPPPTAPTRPPSMITAYISPEWKEAPLQRATFEITKAREREIQRPSPLYVRIPKRAGLATAAFGVGIAQFIGKVSEASLPTYKITPSTKYAKMVVETGKGAITAGPAIGTALKREPAYALTIGALYIGAPKLIAKAPVRVSDIVRTARLKKLPTENIIAPEYYTGQRFPTIRKGQTAPQLMREFKPILPKERFPAGFTAAPKPFAKATEAYRGTSELAGLYQAPRVSPHFLKVGGEEVKMFGLSPFETWRPSIIRVTPTKYELAPMVGRVPTKRPIVKEFFRKDAELGKAYIPFIKTEKEAIIAMGTPLRQVGKRYFIKFEGRRIPISEFEVAKGVKFEIAKGIKMPKAPKKAFTMEDVSRSLSRGRIKPSARITPSRLIYVTRPSYRPAPPSKPSYRPAPPSKPSKYLPAPVTRVPPPPPTYRYYYPPTRYPVTGIPPPPIYRYYPAADVPTYPLTKPPKIRTDGRKVKPLLHPQLKPQPIKYQPSLRARAFRIKAPKISEAYYRGAGGIAIRPIIVTRKRK